MRLIDIQGLHKCYGIGNACAWALNGIDLRIKKGSYCVLEGRSGSGKTTLLNCIGALETPTSGRVLINGEDFHHLNADQRAAFRLQHIGFVFQAYNLMGVLDARENVAYVLQLKGMARKAALEIADDWLELVGLFQFRKRRPAELSGGQQQRVAVARALSTEPDIVLADEPTANLDSIIGGELIELMQKLNNDLNTTFVISSHDPAVIASAQHRVTLFDGRVVS